MNWLDKILTRIDYNETFFLFAEEFVLQAKEF